jgi:hypothetical protein
MPTTTEQNPSDKFKKAMKQILSVPKSELARREAEYKAQRKIKNHHRHR